MCHNEDVRYEAEILQAHRGRGGIHDRIRSGELLKDVPRRALQEVPLNVAQEYHAGGEKTDDGDGNWLHQLVHERADREGDRSRRDFVWGGG